MLIQPVPVIGAVIAIEIWHQSIAPCKVQFVMMNGHIGKGL